MARLAFVLAFVLLAPKPAGAAEASGRAKFQVESLAARAFEMVNEGKYSEAIALYLRAYQAAPLPALLYNIASVYDKRLQKHARALEYYERFLASAEADPGLVKRATARVEALREMLARAAEKPVEDAPSGDAPRAPPPPLPPLPDIGGPLTGGKPVEAPQALSGAKIGGLIAGGAGVVGLGLGLGFGARARSLNEQALKYCTGKTCWDTRGIALTNDAKAAATVSTVSVVAGAAAAVGGAALFLLAPTAGRGVEAQVSSLRFAPAALAGGAGVLLAGEL